MLPDDLPSRPLPLPAVDTPTVLLITDSHPRHLYCASQIMKTFPETMCAWIRIDSSVKPLPASWGARQQERLRRITHRAVAPWIRTDAQAERKQKGIYAGICRLRQLVRYQRNIRQAERSILRELIPSSFSLNLIEAYSIQDPIILETIRAYSPTVIASYTDESIPGEYMQEAPCGMVRLTTGWLPSFGGDDGIGWALYYRRLDRIGSTVHCVDHAGGIGPVVRRSSTVVLPDDTPETVRVRAACLGALLLCESLEALFQATGNNLAACDPVGKGDNLASPNRPDCHARNAIERDARAGWIAEELERVRRF